ncbi:uncharacterized protein PV07_02453 [Cladophialophora immunda]|uniref:Uncharacterized protein n=1 Tax=Cladophialophora immunda TaxID=569365 RepID=A0A0D2D4Z8_9EURO|nr:uncharacterized protein PV07_02453 [Cladophialophora immunda]KIW30749.1 hypothetical protein PV07_02453 [Cladophialophora immunda]OQU99232.1 hypothetical protein CLAIMM_04896 isoform 1 [Cladophialophora immunda]OQU99233.1 hypothetical protein CLAIMM_04896 isoform 2 [Cladophialophora immunda]
MSPFISMRRFSRSGSVHNSQPSASASHQPAPPTSYTPPLSHAPMMPNGTAGSLHDSRPVSAKTSSSFDFANRPPTNYQITALPHSAIGNLSRTDQIVLRHFWDVKYDENKARDLHFLKFPFFPQYPNHQDLIPYCEIYHLVKTSPGAKIISLGSANGVYIGFELFSGSQLHIDMDDSWQNISHHRVSFKKYDKMLKDPSSDATFKSWPKPLTIEFLEEQYGRWMLDLTSLCWETAEVRELGGGGGGGGDGPEESVDGDLKDEML